ncbi:unnamed protein product [Heterobilharzia americana]|nr:unnamed protein product [Heterobilharzia americana]
MSENPVVLCAPTSCTTMSNPNCGSFDASICHSGISSVAVPIASALCSNVLCSSDISNASTVPSILSSSLGSLQSAGNSLNFGVPSSSHNNPVILPESSASLLVQPINPSNSSALGIHSIPAITSTSLSINDLEKSNMTVPMTCQNEFLNANMTNSGFPYSSILPLESSAVCQNPSFMTIPTHMTSTSMEIIHPAQQSLPSSMPVSTSAPLPLPPMLNCNPSHSENVLGFDTDSGSRPLTNQTLPSYFPLNLMPISANGDFPAAQINFPGLPPVLLQVLPLPGVKMGEHYTINVPTQLVWDGISSALASGGTVNGGPIILSITPSPLPSHSISSLSTVPVSSYTVPNQMPASSVTLCSSSNGFINSSLPQVGIPVSAVIPYSSISITSSTSTVTTASVMSTKVPGLIVSPILSHPGSTAGGPRRMRAIAPKPSNASPIATLGIRAASALNTISKSGSKRLGLVTSISGINGIISTSTSLQSSHSSISNIGTITSVPAPAKLLHSHSKKVSLPLVSVSSSLVRSGRGRRRGGVGQHSVSTTFVTSAHASPICITNSTSSSMGINNDTSNLCSLQSSMSLPLSSPSAMSSFFSTQSVFVPPSSNPHVSGPVLPSGQIPPTLLFGNSLSSAPSVTMPSGVAPFLFQPAIPISNSCSQFSNSVFSPATCTISISPSTSCPLGAVRSLPSVSSATIFAANNAPTMASLDPATGFVTYYPSSCISMNNPYASAISSSSDSPSITIPTVCSQPNHGLGLQPSSQSGPIMYPIQAQQLLPNQVVPTIFPNIPDVASMSSFADHTAFLQSFTPGLMDGCCISSNEQISSESTVIQSQIACQNSFFTSASNFNSNNNCGNISIFSSLPVSTIAGLPSLEIATSTCETNGSMEDDACLAKDDLISLAWHLTQMEDDFETNDKQNADVLIEQTEDENNGMFEDFLQVYSQNTTGFNFNSELDCQTHALDPSSGGRISTVADKNVILLDNESEYTVGFENTDDAQLTCANEESTGNADIDALLAAAAMVGAASGVGDAQSAVAVPLPSSSLASVSHQAALTSECDSSHPTVENGDINNNMHLTFDSSLLPSHSTSCKFSPILGPNNAENSVNSLKETKPDELIPSDLFDDFSKTEVNDQFPNDTSDSVHEFDDGYEPTSLAAVLGCNAEDAADLESVLGQEAPDLSEGGGVSDSFLHSLVGPSPTVDDLNDERDSSVNIFDNDFHSPCKPKQETENDLNFHSVDDFPTDIDCDMVDDVTNPLPVSRQVRSLLRDANSISVSSRFGSPPGGSKSFNHFFEATSRRLNRSCRFTSDIDDDFMGVDFSDAVNGCTTAEQFDEALMLLGPQPNSPINQSEMQSENTIPVSVTDFVSHIEDKMKNNENAAKDKQLLHVNVNCTDVKDVVASVTMSITSNLTSPQYTADKSPNSPIRTEESDSQVKCIPSSPVCEVEKYVTKSSLQLGIKDSVNMHLDDPVDRDNSINVVAIRDTDGSLQVESQQTKVDNMANTDDLSCTKRSSSYKEKTEFTGTLPMIISERLTMSIDSKSNSSDKLSVLNPSSIQDSLVDCHCCQVSGVPVSPLSVCPLYDLPKRPGSAGPKVLSDIVPNHLPDSFLNLPPRPRSLPNVRSPPKTEMLHDSYHEGNIFKTFVSNPCSFNIPCLVAASSKVDIDLSGKQPCSASGQQLSVNTEDMVSNMSILGVLASSSALVEAVADLEDDSDISPIKSSIEGLASLDRMLKSCQRRSQQTLESARNDSSTSESVTTSSSQTSGFSQSSAIKAAAACDNGQSNNNDTCSSALSASQNTDLSNGSTIDIPGNNSLSVSGDNFLTTDNSKQKQVKNTDTFRCRRGRGRRIGRKKPHLSYLKKYVMKTSSKIQPFAYETHSPQNATTDTNDDRHLKTQSENSHEEISTNNLLELAVRRPHSFGLSPIEGDFSSVPNPPISPEFESHLPPLVLAAGTSLFPESSLYTDAYSSIDDSSAILPVVDELKVEPAETIVATEEDEKVLVKPLTPQRRIHHSRKRKKRRKHVTGLKPRSRSQIESHSATESQSDHPNFDFDKTNFVAVNLGLLKRFELLDEAPFERFLHDTKLQTFAALKLITNEAAPCSRSNLSSWSEQNVMLFGGQYTGQSGSGDCTSLSTQNIDAENFLNETQSIPDDVPENSSNFSLETDNKSSTSTMFYNHNTEEPVSTSCESIKFSVASHQLMFSTPVSHTFDTLPTHTSLCCVPKSTSPSQSHIPLPIAAAVTQHLSFCESSSSTSHSLEKVFPVISPLPINRNVGIAGSFAGAAAFRATSFSALAAKVERINGTDIRLNNASETLWKNVTFADLAKIATSETKDKEVTQNLTNISSSAECSSWFVDKSMQIDASALRPKPLFQPNFPVVTSPSKTANSSVLFPSSLCTSNASPNNLDNHVSLTDEIKTTVSSLPKVNSFEGSKRSLKRIRSMPKKLIKRKRSANRRQRRPTNSTQKPATPLLERNSVGSDAKENDAVSNKDCISPADIVKSLYDETQHLSSASEKFTHEDCDPSENDLPISLYPNNDNVFMEPDIDKEKHIVSPAVVKNDSIIVGSDSVDINASRVVQTQDSIGQHFPSPALPISSVSCGHLLVMPIDSKNNLCYSEVISPVNEDRMNTLNNCMNTHDEDTITEVSSFQAENFASDDRNVNSEHVTSHIIANKSELHSHPPIRLRLNLKLAQIKCKSPKKKKRKKLQLDNSVVENLRDSVIETKDGPPKCSLSIRFVNRIPLAEDICKPSPKVVSKKRKKKITEGSTCSSDFKKITVIMNSTPQCEKQAASIRLEEASPTLSHNTGKVLSGQTNVMSDDHSKVVKDTSMNPLSTKKIFSTARQERRSNYAQLTRPWRANLSTSPRKRSTAAFRPTSSRRHGTSLARSRIHLPTSLLDQKEPNIPCADSTIPGNIFNENTSNCDSAEKSYSITNSTSRFRGVPEVKRPECPSLRLIIRLGKSSNVTKDEQTHQSAISPLTIQVPSDRSSTSSQASVDKVCQHDGDINLPVLAGQYNRECSGSVREIPGFCIASEAETFMDPNQFQIHRILNRALPINSGLLSLYIPSPSGDDDGGDCGIVGRVLDSEHRLHMTDQSFTFSQVRHENHTTPVAPQIGCTAGLSNRKERKSSKHQKCNKRNIKHFRYRYRKSYRNLAEECTSEQLSNGFVPRIRSFKKHTEKVPDTDLNFICHQSPTNSFGLHQPNFSEPNITYSSDSNRISNRVRFSHNSPESLNAVGATLAPQYNSEDKSVSSNNEMLWCKPSSLK